ncbi:YopX family protein [Helicobacter cinaedi]|uniref:YopX protein n=1 Tax=Helicobacter cinaedi TaxID=213 RepID=A0A377JWF3_9HELI|nr:YopX family protein [Helicobacter cinaedi]STP13342.1 YopX protein [Helicobacter cinaedi]STP13372.1 YopX protein [Helicobacter cinaedi]STP13735.1 YopX protein [Helicobacter cinaedi]STP13744.1 YopX protein [Helicobacter cinaedi]
MKLANFDFRIWHKNSKSFVEMNIRGTDLRIIPTDDDYNMELELWSGFYDCKGTKIYEGDIVKYDSRTNPLVVVFERNTFYIVDTSIEKHLQVDCGTRLQAIYDNRSNGYTNNKLECLEVLGNIHENAELLKEQK